jgi:hypothetical protein
MHKFHLGQPVEFNPPRGIYAPGGAYVVTAKLPERDGAFEYRVRNAAEGKRICKYLLSFRTNIKLSCNRENALQLHFSNGPINNKY